MLHTVPQKSPSCTSMTTSATHNLLTLKATPHNSRLRLNCTFHYQKSQQFAALLSLVLSKCNTSGVSGGGANYRSVQWSVLQCLLTVCQIHSTHVLFFFTREIE